VRRPLDELRPAPGDGAPQGRQAQPDRVQAALRAGHERRPGHAPQDLLRKVWGRGYGEETEYLRVYVRYLRQKLEADSSKPQYILTEPGVGYRFVDPSLFNHPVEATETVETNV
jgi:hypothetical protein